MNKYIDHLTIEEYIKHLLEYDYVGIRVQDDVPFELGNFAHCSKNFESRDIWNVDESDMEDAEDLDGASAWSLIVHGGDIANNFEEVVNNCIEYYGHCAILVSESATYGMDEGEIVMESPEVIAVIK